MVVLVMLPIAWATAGAIVLPVVALAVLTFVPLVVTGSYDPQNRYIDNGFVGRFVLSARILGEFDLSNWFALAAARAQAFDSGYAYIVGRIGVVGLAIFWLLPFAMSSKSVQFSSFRNAVAFYFGTILCVSNSPFTIKTASLLWFLVGVLAVAGRPQTAPMALPRRTGLFGPAAPLRGRLTHSSRTSEGACASTVRRSLT
jgi:putative polymerase